MSQLLQFHFDLGDKLRADTYLADVPIVQQVPKDRTLGGQIENRLLIAIDALAGLAGSAKIGISIWLPLPKLGSSKPDVPGPYYDQLTAAALVMEDPFYNVGASGFAPNGSGLFGDDYAEHIAKTCHQWSDDGVTSNIQTRAFEGEALKVKLEKEQADAIRERNLFVYAVEFAGSLLADRIPKVEQPRITESAGLVTVATNTAGADLYYTLDGSFPTRTNGTLFTAPFSITTPVDVRVVGYYAADAINPSNAAWKRIV